ncbi:MAG: LysR family transcriptional regulator substrate-binding protein, partial [Synechococcaceae cyanobacterium SM2_3_60]|nr:LysR family transcriptional regulator substrate-binding protein [Synechococcaceae cyanobacterium SM2_3_60]
PTSWHAFSSSIPRVSITLKEYCGDGHIHQALLQGAIDVGFMCKPLSDDLEGWEIARDEYQVLFPPAVALPPRLDWAFIQQFPMIIPSPSDTCSELIRQHFVRLQLPLRTDYEIQEDSTTVGMVLRGLAIAIMAQLAAAPLPPTIQTRPLPVPLRAYYPVSLCLPKGCIHLHSTPFSSCSSKHRLYP